MNVFRSVGYKFLVLIALPTHLFATNIDLDHLDFQQVINGKISYHVEKDDHFGIEEIIDQDALFVEAKNGALNFGYFDDHVWLKFTLSSTRPQDIYLELGPYWIDSLQLFAFSKGQPVSESQLTGNRFHTPSQFPYFDENMARYIIPISTTEGKTTVYLKMYSKYIAKRITLKLWEKQKYDTRTVPLLEQKSFRYAVLGIIAFICIFSLSLSIVIRRKIFALYAFFISTHILNLFSVKGWLYPFYQLFELYSYDYKGPINGLLVISTTLYVYYIIPKKHSIAWLRSSILIICIICVILFPIPIFIQNSPSLFRFLVIVFKPLFFVAVPITFGHFYTSARKGFKISWLLLASHSLIAINALFHFLQVLGVFGIFHNNYTWEIALFVEIILYTTAMIYYYKIDVVEREKMELELIKQKQMYISDLYHTQENERIRIARDLHDSIGMKLSVVSMMLSSDPAHQKIKSFVDETIQETRSISHNLMPEEINLGLKTSLANLVSQFEQLGKISIGFEFDDNITTDQTQNMMIYRITQEILNNMIKHSTATKIKLRFRLLEEHILWTIVDNGSGFDTKLIHTSKGIGWKNIYARISVLKGTMNITSSAASGTSINITLPY